MSTKRHSQESVGVILSGVKKLFGSARAVDGITLNVAPGEFVALLGSSGSGKTTTLMMIAGFLQPDEGEILIGDSNVTNVSPHRRGIGVVYQHYLLFPHMTVGGNIAFPLQMRGLSKNDIRQRVEAVLEVVDLKGFADRLPSELSGGQQQRVALARAIVFQPSVLLMDEPLGALDSNLRVQMQTEIKHLQRKLGITTIYVTHDQTEALTLSDRIVVMRAGRIEQVGTPENIYTRPVNHFVAGFMGATNFIPGVVVSAGKKVLVRLESGAHIAAEVGEEVYVNDVVQVVVRAERLKISTDDAEAQGLITAQVRSSMYVGGARRYDVSLSTGEQLAVIQTDLRLPVLASGQRIKLWWDPADAWIIPVDRSISRRPAELRSNEGIGIRPDHDVKDNG
jgi:putative spermidine/putrescine transport system ATP-binding protein